MTVHQCHPTQLRARGHSDDRHLLHVPSRTDLGPGKGQSSRARAPGWRPGAACRSQCPPLGTWRQAGLGRAESHLPSLGQGSQHPPRSSCGCFEPSACQAVRAERGWGSGDFTPRHRRGAEAQQKRPGRLGSCPGPPAPLTSRPRPPPGLEPSRPRPNSDDTSGKVNAVWKHSAIPKGSGGKRSRGAATMLAAPGSAPGCAPPTVRPRASCLPLWGSPAPV